MHNLWTCQIVVSSFQQLPLTCAKTTASHSPSDTSLASKEVSKVATTIGLYREIVG